MRIGLIAPPWLPVPPRAYGGTEAVIDRLARGFEAAGHEVVLFATGDSSCPVETRWAFEHALQDVSGRTTFELRQVIHAYEQLAGCDVVHDHTVAGPAYAGRPPCLPVVTTNHGPFDDEFGDIYRAVAGAVALVAISEHQASTAGDIRIAAVIHHGIDVDAVPVGDGSGGYLAYVGRMTADKGVREACEVARAAGMPLRLAAKMREPAEQAYFEEEVRPLLGGEIAYAGELDRDDTAALVGGATALVNPIRWPEPFGLVMVEALAAGTPVVAFPCGAAPEIVDEGVTGYLASNVEEMARRIGEIGRIDRRACRSAAEERFSTRRMVDDHLALYQRLVGARPAAGAAGRAVA